MSGSSKKNSAGQTGKIKEGLARKRLTVEIPSEVDDALEFACSAYGKTKMEVTTEALKEWVAKRKEEVLKILADRFDTI